MNRTEGSFLAGAGQLWHGDELVAGITYELRQSTDPSDSVTIRGRVFGLSEDQIRALFGKRLTLCLTNGESGDCFLADVAGSIILTAHGLRG